eukprot:NODE_304_length_10309_cov_0.478355.p12 type:complete len:100 gc:universal NODE_304_length_10309_cov_0.478355:9345-9046(-)
MQVSLIKDPNFVKKSFVALIFSDLSFSLLIFFENVVMSLVIGLKISEADFSLVSLPSTLGELCNLGFLVFDFSATVALRLTGLPFFLILSSSDSHRRAT